MAWHNSAQSFIWIFPVGRGNAAFLRTPLNHGIILDMAGSDADDESDVFTFIAKNFISKLTPYGEKKHKLAQVILSHPHTDHIAQCDRLVNEFSPCLITCPNDKVLNEAVDWTRIRNIDGETSLNEYRQLFAARTPPLQTLRLPYGSAYVPNLEYGLYWIRPPQCAIIHPTDENEYGNATSIVVYYRHGQHTILFPGDMTPLGMEHLLGEGLGSEKRYTIFDNAHNATTQKWHDTTLDQPSLKSQLQTYGLTVLVAPHHGLESCYSPELYNVIRGNQPKLAVISERRHKHENDGRTDRRYLDNGGSGLRVTVDRSIDDYKKYVSTINNHHILIVFNGNGRPIVYADKDRDFLLSRLANI